MMASDGEGQLRPRLSRLIPPPEKKVAHRDVNAQKKRLQSS